MADQTTTLSELRQAMQKFVDERDWRQFHTPKNLSMSLAIEAAELMEHFQWVNTEDSLTRGHDPVLREQIADEVADVCCYLLSMVNALDFDLSEIVAAKLVKNAKKYPAETFRGRFEKQR